VSGLPFSVSARLVAWLKRRSNAELEALAGADLKRSSQSMHQAAYNRIRNLLLTGLA